MIVANKTRYIQLKNVSKTYFSPAGNVNALHQVNMSIDQGSFVGVIGKSGAGKSTLVNVLTGVDRLTEGELWIDGFPLHHTSQEKITHWRGKTMGVVFQSFELLNQISILDNVLLPLDLCGNYSRASSVKRAMQILAQLEIAEHAQKPPASISGGQRQRVAIARALINDPQIIVADEPTGSLDSQTSMVIFKIFKQIVKSGKTVVMVTHDQQLLPLFDHLFLLVDGVIRKEAKRGKHA
ncbi:MAG: ABC transporter ATP-binding protein [Chloroflexi bacterium HGW-Chloroflexi-3]|nr:MAG: ABC transporter ATP-binding protein [Chloroflexi bacterium HGW-Chloroflexi-3]